MKLLMVLASLITLCFSNAIPTVPSDAIPTVPGDNSHYVKGQSRYIWVPDNDGNPHLVDLHKPVNEDFLRTRNGADNTYWLLSRQNPITPQQIIHNDTSSIWASNYQADRPIVVLIHGWNGFRDSSMNAAYTFAFLNSQECNVIILDWERLAAEDYNTAAAGVYDVGEHLGRFLVWLINTAGGNWDNVHMIGFSLGVHLTAIAGRTAGGRVGRITALDPAGPSWHDSEDALNRNDAQYVEAIHTDGGNLGIFTRSGHADFYPNGGREPQAGCALDTVCSHMRVIDYFESSLWYNRMVGRECTDIEQAENMQCTGAPFNMGNSDFSKRGPSSGSGIYGMRTANLWPF